MPALWVLAATPVPVSAGPFSVWYPPAGGFTVRAVSMARSLSFFPGSGLHCSHISCRCELSRNTACTWLQPSLSLISYWHMGTSSQPTIVCSRECGLPPKGCIVALMPCRTPSYIVLTSSHNPRLGILVPYPTMRMDYFMVSRPQSDFKVLEAWLQSFGNQETLADKCKKHCGCRH